LSPKHRLIDVTFDLAVECIRRRYLDELAHSVTRSRIAAHVSASR
jgi:hypothetical protein